MKTYRVTVREEIYKTITVEAKNADDAKDQAEEADSSEFIPDYDMGCWEVHDIREIL